jgi:hypothetical protein
MPIDKEEFDRVSSKLEEEIVSFLKKRQEKAFTADEMMGSISFHIDFDLAGTSKIAMFMAANFVAVLHDLVSEGKISRKVVHNRMHFMAIV